MIWKSKRFLALLVVVVCIWMGVFFRHELFQFGVEAFLNGKVTSKGWKFDYEKIDVTKGQISFSKVSFVTKEAFAECQIERIDILMKHRKGLQFDFWIHIHSPLVSLKKESSLGFSLWDYAKSPFSRVRINVDGAEVQFIGGEERTKFYFSLESDEKRHSLGTFYLSECGKGGSDVVLKVHEWPEGWIAEFELQEARLSWLSKIVNLFQECEWDIRKGVANGRVFLGFSKEGGITQANASLRVADVIASHEGNGLQGEIESLSIDASYPMQYIAMDIKGGRIGCNDVKTGLDFALCDLSGRLNFHSFKDSEILLKGYLDHKDQMTRVVLSVNPSGTDKETLDVDLKLSESLSSTHLNLAIAREGEDLCVVRGRLKEMGVDQIAMIQHVIGFFSPEVKGFQLKKGKVTSELSLRVVNGKVEKVLLDGILADDLEVYWTSRDILATCAHLSGSAKIDFQNLFSFEVPNWEVNLQNGELFRGGDEPVLIQNISMQLFVCRNVFEPSWIRATYSGIDVLLDVMGYYSEADVKMHLSTKGDQLLKLFCKNDPAQFNGHNIHTDIEFHRQLGYWEVLGNVYLNLIEDWEDFAKFGCFISDRIFEKENWKEAVSKGFFETDSISCEFMKLISFCMGVDWVFEGVGSFKGNFNGKGIDVGAKFSYANFFSPSLDLRLNPSSDPEHVKPSEGKFSWNFESGKFCGEIPIYQALIHEKSTGLVFRDTRGELCFDAGSISLKKFVTESEGVIFGGNLECKGDDFQLEINSLIGSVRQIENLRLPIPKLPFDGLIRNKEGRIVLSYSPKKGLEVDLSLELVHGSWEILPGLTVHELSFDFELSLEEQKVVLTNVVGKIPSTFHEGGYVFNGKEIEFSLGNKSNVQFDVRLENQMMDLVRLVGVYDFGTRVLELNNKISHLFTVHPDFVFLALDETFLPKELEVALKLPLKSSGELLADIKVVEEVWLELLNKVDLKESEINAKLSLKGGIWGLELSTEEGQCHIAKDKEGWKLSKLKVHSFEMSGELKGDKICNLKVLGDRSSITFGEGTLDLEKKMISLPIQEGLIDLEEIALDQGRVTLGGVLEIDFSKGLSQSFASAKIQAQGERGPFHLQSVSDVHLIYTWDQGLVIQDTVFQLDDKSIIEIPFASYSFEENVCQGYQIKVVSDEIGKVLRKMGFEVEVPQKSSGKTEVVFDVEFSQDHFKISGLLSEGKYVWKGKEIELGLTKWFYDKNALDMDIKLPFWGSQFDIHVKVYPDGNGRTIIEGFENGEKALYVECKLFDNDGLFIQKLQGNVFGLEFQFLPKEEFVFLGDIKIDVDRLKPLLDKEVRQLIEDLKFHKGYELKGELTLKKENLQASFFEGYLKGRDFDLLGYVLKTLLANIRIDQKGVYIKNLSVSDEGVTATIADLNIDVSGKGGMSLNAPEVRIDELRPSLLKKAHGRQRLKPFCIKTMIFQDVSGNLADIRSFTGRGHLKFINTFKEGHNLLDIPIEIISRLGLDIGLLVPIQGEMEYVIKNGKLVFTKLKNSFSESKRSYFYLWNKSESYVDFYGNMHIDIRMKQYVLFKITELFILSVQGTLEKPKCFLR